MGGVCGAVSQEAGDNTRYDVFLNGKLIEDWHTAWPDHFGEPGHVILYRHDNQGQRVPRERDLYWLETPYQWERTTLIGHVEIRKKSRIIDAYSYFAEHGNLGEAPKPAPAEPEPIWTVHTVQQSLVLEFPPMINGQPSDKLCIVKVDGAVMSLVTSLTAVTEILGTPEIQLEFKHQARAWSIGIANPSLIIFHHQWGGQPFPHATTWTITPTGTPCALPNVLAELKQLL